MNQEHTNLSRVWILGRNGKKTDNWFWMLYQNLISVAIVSMLSLLGVVSTEPLTWRLIEVWFPMNVIFAGMLITSMFSWKQASEMEILRGFNYSGMLQISYPQVLGRKAI